MKQELTQAETELMQVVKDEWVNLALKQSDKGIDKQLFTKGINWLYTDMLKLKNPEIVYCDGIISALIKVTLVKDYNKEISDYKPEMIDDFNNGRLDKEFTKHMQHNHSLRSNYCGWSDFGWVSFADYFTKIGVINNDNFNNYIDIVKSNVFDCIQFENVVFAIEPPIVIIKNQDDRLHNTSGPAISFKDGGHFYFINGRNIESHLFTKGFTKEEYLAETNEDVRGAMYEIIEAKGEGSMLEFLKAYEYAKDTIKHVNGDDETIILYRTHEIFPELVDINGKQGVPLCWLRLVCPSTSQNYLISTDSSFTSPREAIKFHRPEEIPFDLEYSFFSRS